jgi:hypothetical protein
MKQQLLWGKKERTFLFNAIRKRTRFLRKEELKRVISEMGSTPVAARRHEILRQIRLKQHTKGFELLNAEGGLTQSPHALIEMVSKHYLQFFNPATMTNVDPWGHYSGALDNPIQAPEFSAALRRSHNGRAAGPDGIPTELLKYGGDAIPRQLSDIVNSIYSNHSSASFLGEGTLCPLNKPGKPKTVSNVRPITLLNTTRKLLSLVILERIYPSIEVFLPPTQSGFRRGGSTTEIAWLYSWIRASAHRYARPLHILGVDMTAAFDTIDRNKLLFILVSIIPVSEQRLIRTLLSKTTLMVRARGYIGAPIPTIQGIPQGDALSPVLFIIYLEAALREIRAIDNCLYGKTPGTGWRKIEEAGYADDLDLIASDPGILETTLQRMIPIFGKYNLRINENKTERKTFDSSLQSSSNYKKLGSSMDMSSDVVRRIQLAQTAYRSMWKVWNSRHVPIKIKLQLYEVSIKSLLMYNIASTYFTETQIVKLESAHRYHLRGILGIFYPEVISNVALYKRAGVPPLRCDVAKARLQFLRKMLLKPTTHPAHRCMVDHFSTQMTLKTRGRANTIPYVIHRDLSLCGKSLRTREDFTALAGLARTPAEWKTMTENILKALQLAVQSKLLAAQERRRLKRVHSEMVSGPRPRARTPKRPRRNNEDESQASQSAGSNTYPTLIDASRRPESEHPSSTLRRSSRVRRLSTSAQEYDFGNNFPEEARPRKKPRTAARPLRPPPHTPNPDAVIILGSRRADTETNFAFGTEIGRDG